MVVDFARGMGGIGMYALQCASGCTVTAFVCSITCCADLVAIPSWYTVCSGCYSFLVYCVFGLLFLPGILFVGCLTSQQHTCASQRWICSDKFMYCHTEIEVADQTFYITQSQYANTRPTSPSTDPLMPGAWQGRCWSANI